MSLVSAFHPFQTQEERDPRQFASADVKSNAESFRKRASECRDVANGTRDPEAQRELRELAVDLDDEAAKIEIEDSAMGGKD